MLRLLAYLLVLIASALPLSAVAGSCSILTADGSTLIDFATVSSLRTTPADGQGQISFSCTPDVLTPTTPVSYQVKIGSGNSGTFTPRQLMHSSGATLNYNLYTDSARTQIFGDGTAGTATVSGNCLLACVPVVVYGRIPINQWGPPGDYQDTVTVTLEFN
ncbi:MAG: spore coat U domain-containing protein [Alcanivorax sp.]|nr:spore coat U domain-containing protein [Alcanivorax sp.]